MIEVLVWLLIVSPVTHHGGVPHTLATFKTQAQCHHVRDNMNPDKIRSYYSQCVQANIYVQGVTK